MFTNCPTCARQFRIRTSQLATAEGLVQCGFCGKQFNALERLYDKPLVIDTESMAATSIEELAEPDFDIQLADEDVDTAENLETTEAEDPEEMIIVLPETEPEPKTEPEPETEPGPISEPEPLFKPAQDPQHPAALSDPVVEYSPDADYPFPNELVEETAPQASTVSRMFWSFGVLFLFLAVMLQVAWFNRDILLSHYPQFLPQARQICQMFDCVLIRNRNISAIKLVNRDVRVHHRYEDALLVNATITNLSKYVQKFPQVLLSLFDTNGEVIAYRLIPASEYLDSSIDQEAGMIPDSPIHFVFEVANSRSDAVSFEFDFL